MALASYRNKNTRRPRKHGKAKRQRIAVQKRRLVIAGHTPEAIEKMTNVDIRGALRVAAKEGKI